MSYEGLCKTMISASLWRGLAFLFVMVEVHEAQQFTCDIIVESSHQQKLQDITETRDQIKHWTDYVTTTFFLEYDEIIDGVLVTDLRNKSLTIKYNDDFADIENKFQVKMKILNETKDIKNVVQAQKKKFNAYQESKLKLFNTIYQYNPTNELNELYYTDNITIMLSTARCGPCVDQYKYFFCLTVEGNRIREVLQRLKLKIKQFKEDILPFNKIKRWDFVYKARRASRDAFNALNRTLTVKQIKDYYKTKLVPLYEEAQLVKEKDHNYWRTDELLTSSKTVLDILQFVLGKIKEPVVVSNCDYVSVMKNIVNVISSIVSPYQRFPIWDLDDFVTKYIRPIQNVTDVDLLIKILEDALKAGRVETKSSLPAVLHQFLTNPYEKSIRFAMYDLHHMVISGYCRGVSVIKDAGQAAWNVFDCLAEVLRGYKNQPDNIFYFLRNLNNIEKYRVCLKKTQNL